MPNLEELIKIREEAIKKYIDANVLEKFLFDCTKNYYDDFIVKELISQAEGDLKNSDISVCDYGIFITTDNKEKSKLFFDEIVHKDLKFFSYEDIDNVSTKDDPIVYVTYFKGLEKYNYFIRLTYIKSLLRMMVTILEWNLVNLWIFAMNYQLNLKFQVEFLNWFFLSKKF